ncbi:NAD(P)/FAD-dependent oxidoreductase [Pandoraea horticolens]|nr:FAD-binding oxidoreductase [Pandoraea horticolens]
MTKFDAVVLGGGIVGVSAAIHLQRRGVSVALVDKREPGRETSFGNAGLIQREGVYPYAFPRGMKAMLKYAANRSPDVRYHFSALPSIAPFLSRYWYHSAPHRHAEIARQYSAIIEHCVDEHRSLVDLSGATALLRDGGWLKVFRSAATFNASVQEATKWRQEFDVPFELLDAKQLRASEPSLSHDLFGAVRYTSAKSLSDPGALVEKFCDYFSSIGGRVFLGDARTLSPGWSVETREGTIQGRHVVLAAGPWSSVITDMLGYRLPLAVKRGYHRHYTLKQGARLNQPVLDQERGFLLAPMTRGVRLTTGVEFGLRDARHTPVQLAAVEPMARSMLPMGEPIESEPWMGCRPCTPDMKPVIGPAPKHKDMWFAFGHAHHGLTLGPVTGRLIAEMITGERTLLDPTPFSADRF